MSQATKIQKIKQMITLFVLAFLSAILLTLFFLYFYGPTGYYVAGNTLLAPEVMKKLNYKEENSRSKGQANYLFNGIEFTYFDKISGKLSQSPVAPDAYEKFYQLIAAEKSVVPIPTSIDNEFSANSPTLTLTVRPENATAHSPGSKVFQVVQFSETDDFRIQLHGLSETPEWAYFHRPNIYQDAMRLFTKS